MTLIVNLYGGPGTGKSTTAAAVFAELKQSGYNAELVGEYAKDRVWDNHLECLNDQIYLFGKQYHRIHRLLNKVDIIITDAPLLLSVYYGRNHPYKNFTPLVLEVHRSLENFDVFLRRVKPYNPSGRTQDEEGAKQIDVDLKAMLDIYNITYCEIDADRSATRYIAQSAANQLSSLKGGEGRGYLHEHSL